MPHRQKPARTVPSADQVLSRMRAMGSARVRASQERFAVGPKKRLGLTAPQIQRLAREIPRDHRLARRLWNSGIHEARHLAYMIEEPAKVTAAQMERWARQFHSWDIVDGCCRYLFLCTPHAWRKALEWSRREEEYVKRAGFALMAYLAVHDKQARDEQFLRLLPRIRREASDPRNFVKKAVNWALRQIGKRNPALNVAAIRTAEDIRREAKAIREPARRSAALWIAADALRELRSPTVARRLRARKA